MPSLTPTELLKRVFLGRVISWRKKLEKLDGALAAKTLKILAAGDQKIRDAVQKELPNLLEASPKRAQIVLWTKELTDPIAENLVDTIADGWAVSALNSLHAYNQILTFDGNAKAVQPVPETIDTLKKLAGGKPFKNKSLKEMVDALFTGGVGGAVLAAVDQGRKNGWGYEKIVKNALKETLPNGQVMARRDAITLSRSFVQQASVNAQLATYWANRDVVKGVRWTAILDNRVCLKCAALDGQGYLWNEQAPTLIAHPRCRCLWLPMVKSYRELGLDIDDLERAARPFVVREDGNVDTGGRKILYAGTSKEDFGGWWKTLPYKEQIKSVGPIRTQLLNAGKISWDDLIDRNTGRIFTLAELGYSEGGKVLNHLTPNIPVSTYIWLRKVVHGIRTGSAKPRNERRIVGKIDEKLYESLKRAGINLETNDISVSDKDIIHATRESKVEPLPIDIWKNLPVFLENPKNIYWDKERPGIIYVIEAGGKLGKIIVQPNYKAGRGAKAKITNNVRTGKILKSLTEFKDQVHFKKFK